MSSDASSPEATLRSLQGPITPSAKHLTPLKKLERASYNRWDLIYGRSPYMVTICKLFTFSWGAPPSSTWLPKFTSLFLNLPSITSTTSPSPLTTEFTLSIFSVVFPVERCTKVAMGVPVRA